MSVATDFFLNMLLTADADTALGGIRSEADGLSYHDKVERTFNVNEHMLATMTVSGNLEDALSMPTVNPMSFTSNVTTNILTVTIPMTLEEAQAKTWQTVGNGNVIEVELKAPFADAGIYMMEKVSHDYTNSSGGADLSVVYNGGDQTNPASFTVTVNNEGVNYANLDTIAGSNTNRNGTFTYNGTTEEWTYVADITNFTAVGQTESATDAYAANGDTIVLTSNAILGGVNASTTGRVDDNTFTAFTGTAGASNGTIEDHSDSETTGTNAARVTVSGAVRVGQTEFNALGGSDAGQKAQIHMGRRANTSPHELVAAASYTPILLGDSNTTTLIDAFAQTSNTRDEKMWESLLTQLALTSMTQYVPEADFSGVNLIDFGAPLQSKAATGELIDDTVSRGLYSSYLGYVSNAGGQASTFAEMVRSIKEMDLTVPEHEAARDALGQALYTANRLVAGTNNTRNVQLNAGDRLHLTVQIDVEDADTADLSGQDRMSPNWLAFPAQYDNATETSTVMAEGADNYETSIDNAVNATVERDTLLQLGSGGVRIPRPTEAYHSALRLRFICQQS